MDISIILPIYNVKEYLDDCLSHLQCLKYPNVEIIAVNDGSTDGSSDILSNWSKKLQLTIINQTNSGLSAARNAGLNVAKGEYVAFIDSDDYTDTDKLEAMFHLARQSKADIIIGDYWEFIDGRISQNIERRFIPALCNQEITGTDFLGKYYKPLRSVVWRSIYKRSFLIENNLKFHEGACFEDVEFTPIAFCKAKKVVYSGIPFYYYRKRDNSITTSGSSEKKVLDAISIWRILNEESDKINNPQISLIFRELGFHCFLNQYSMLEKDMPKKVLDDAKSLSLNKMKTFKYNILAIAFKLLPDNIFHKLLKYQK